MNNLASAIEKGRVRGFDEIKEIDGERVLFQYAIKKKNGMYTTYLFYIPETKLEIIEDYAVEEIKEFSNLADAIYYFESMDINIKQFSRIKGTLPL